MSYLDFYIIEEIKKIRIKSKPYLDQVSLSQKIGVSEGYIGRIENPKLRGKYNIEILTKVARAIGLKSYNDLFPQKILTSEIVTVLYKPSGLNNKKLEIDENGNIIGKYKIVSIKPLNVEEIKQWKKEGKPYLKILNND